MGELLIRVLLVKLVEELGGEQKTSGSILKHFICCRWQLPYIWGHDPPRKWDQSRWLNKWQLTRKDLGNLLKVPNE